MLDRGLEGLHDCSTNCRKEESARAFFFCLGTLVSAALPRHSFVGHVVGASLRLLQTVAARPRRLAFLRRLLRLGLGRRAAVFARLITGGAFGHVACGGHAPGTCRLRSRLLEGTALLLLRPLLLECARSCHNLVVAGDLLDVDGRGVPPALGSWMSAIKQTEEHRKRKGGNGTYIGRGKLAATGVSKISRAGERLSPSVPGLVVWRSCARVCCLRGQKYLDKKID